MSLALTQKTDLSWATNSSIMKELSNSLHLEEKELFYKNSLGVFGIFSLILSFLSWSYFATFNNSLHLQGAFIATDVTKTIQSSEGGIVSSLAIEEGQWVEKDQTLLTLEGGRIHLELEELRLKELAINIKVERLRSSGLNQKPNFERFPPEAQNIITQQRSIYDLQLKNKEDQVASITDNIEQQKSLLAVSLGQEKDYAYQLSVVEQQRDTNKKLFEQRLKTRSEYFYLEEEVAKVQKDLNFVRKQLLQIRQAILDLQSKLVDLDVRFRNEALNEMNALFDELTQLKEQKLKTENKLNGLEVKSPMRGIVKNLNITTIGQVIQPSAPVMQIVPTDDLEIEATITPKDVSLIKEGQLVTIKISSYAPLQPESLNGTVKSIDQTYLNEKNEPCPKILIKGINKTYLGDDPKMNKIAPDMLAELDIAMGQKTLWQYLFS